MTLLSTKKLKPNQRELVLNAGTSFVEYDAIHIKFVDVLLSRKLTHLIITSQNGAKALLHSNLDSADAQIYCVGQKTAAFLFNSGHEVVETATNAADLGKIITEKYNQLTFDYLCGDRRREELPEILKAAGVSCKEVVLYKTHLVEKKFEQEFDAILFFSPSGVYAFAKANKTNATAVCIGETTAAAAKEFFKNITVAKTTSVESVIARAVKIIHDCQPRVDRKN